MGQEKEEKEKNPKQNYYYYYYFLKKRPLYVTIVHLNLSKSWNGFRVDWI